MNWTIHGRRIFPGKHGSTNPAKSADPLVHLLLIGWTASNLWLTPDELQRRLHLLQGRPTPPPPSAPGKSIGEPWPPSASGKGHRPTPLPPSRHRYDRRLETRRRQRSRPRAESSGLRQERWGASPSPLVAGAGGAVGRATRDPRHGRPQQGPGSSPRACLSSRSCRPVQAIPRPFR
jgi:hypothetical protein